LSGGSQNYVERYLMGSKTLSALLNNPKTQTPLDLNLSFLKSQMELSCFNYAVVNVSSLEHYRDLLERLSNIDPLPQEQIDQVEKLKQESYPRLAWCDDYGSVKRPTLSGSYLKYRINKMINRIKDIFNSKSWI
jgi:hypothetical protein